MPSSVVLTLSAGDLPAYEAKLARHEAVRAWLRNSGSSYGLPTEPAALDTVQRETLEAVYPNAGDEPVQIDSPASLAFPPLVIELSSSAGLRKTVANFVALATDPPQHKSKRSPYAALSYLSDVGRRVFRMEPSFVAQMGDVTRGDGSGGESIYGGSFNDEKEGLKMAFQQGTVAMANAGKNSNTSQFFITLASSPAQLAKLSSGKYVAFGLIDVSVPGHRETFERLSALTDGKSGTTVPVWISACSII